MVKDERYCEEVSMTGASRAVSVQHHGDTICAFSQDSCVSKQDPKPHRRPTCGQDVMLAKR
jgi:hypothetical protein